MQSFAFGIWRRLRLLFRDFILQNAFLAAGATSFFFPLAVHAQQGEVKSQPVIVQPGAPGQPTRVLPASTRAQLLPTSPKDVEFMQGMIMHHAQAIEMSALMDS